MAVAPPKVQVKDHTFELFLSAATLQERIARLGAQISQDFAGQRPFLLGVLNGAFIFTADLARHISADLDISFIRYASYEGMQSSGKIRSLLPVPDSVAGRPVIIVEDIVDTGQTMQHIMNQVQEKGARSVHIASLLLKPDALTVELSVDYLGFEIENRFVVGYGLDYDGHGRQLDSLYALAD